MGNFYSAFLVFVKTKVDVLYIEELWEILGHNKFLKWREKSNSTVKAREYASVFPHFNSKKKLVNKIMAIFKEFFLE